MNKPLRIGTRESKLAIWQANYIQSILNELSIPSIIIPIKSTGDIDLVTPLYDLGITGVFTKELDVALLSNQIDLAVHSLKDVPTSLPKGLDLIGTSEREDPLDVLVINPNANSNIVATSSVRRSASWKNKFPNDSIVSIRGNVQTRIKKLYKSNYKGAIFAKAGLQRLELLDTLETQDLKWMTPAPSQGIVGVVARKNDDSIPQELYSRLVKKSFFQAKLERRILKELLGGCSSPIGCLVEFYFNAESNLSIADDFHSSLENNSLDKIKVNCTVLNQSGSVIIDCIKEYKSYNEDLIVSDVVKYINTEKDKYSSVSDW